MQVKAATLFSRKMEEKLSEVENDGQSALLMFLEQYAESSVGDVSKMSVCELQLATCFLRKALVAVGRASQMSMLKFVFDSLEISLNVLLLICRARLATVQSNHNNQGESEAQVCSELSRKLGRVISACFHETPGLSQQVFTAGKTMIEQAGFR